MISKLGGRVQTIGVIVALVVAAFVYSVIWAPYIRSKTFTADVGRFIEGNFTDALATNEIVVPATPILFSNMSGLWEVRFEKLVGTDWAEGDKADRAFITELISEMAPNTNTDDLVGYSFVRGQISDETYTSCRPDRHCKVYLFFKDGHGLIVAIDN